MLVVFLGGDPDRPVIAGVAPNVLQPSVVTDANNTKNVVQTGGLNRITMEDADGRQYIHIRTPHKNSFIHIGSTFNPQYNHITNTDGTSLGYTTQLSTSFVGDDAETIVERARVTVIGRGMMTSEAQAGAEVASVLGTSFITNMESEDESDQKTAVTTIKGHASDAFSAAQTSAAAAAALSSPSPVLGPLLLLAEKAEEKASVLQSDASTWASNHIDPTTSKPDSASGAFLDAANTAQRAASEAVAAVNAALAAWGTSRANPADAGAASALATALALAQVATAAVVTAVNTAMGLVSALQSSDLPDSPHSDVTPQYINILRGPSALQPGAAPNGQNSFPLPDGTAAPPFAGDTTALDVLDTNAYPGAEVPSPAPPPAPFREPGTVYPLNAGSDVKVVGGDNVTLTANEARSHTCGHAYSLVQAGQTSVVYSPDKYAGASGQAASNPDPQDEQAIQTAQNNLTTWEQTNPRPTPPAPTHVTRHDKGSPPRTVTLPPTRGAEEEYLLRLDAYNAKKKQLESAVTAAQNTLQQDMTVTRPPSPSLPHGWSPYALAQASSAYGNVRSWLDGNTDVTVTGHKWADMQGGVTTTIGQRAGDAWAHDTTVNGNQSSTVNGHVHSFIAAGQDSTINSGQTVNITGGKTSTVVGVNFSGTAPMNISADVMKLAMAAVSVNLSVTSLAAFDVHVSTGILNARKIMYKAGSGGVKMDSYALANVLTCGLYSVL